MDLVGRDVELATISRGLSDVRGGAKRALGIVGEPGIGKSALLAAIAAGADRLLVASGRAAEHERDVPFSLVRDAFVDHLPQADGGCPLPAPNAAERFQQHRDQRGQIERLGPAVILFDDVQWADDASLELIVHLLNRPPETPHLLVFALRPSAVATRILDAARRHPGFEQLAPAPLDDDAARTLLGDIPGREQVIRDAAGIPLYLRELARAAAPLDADTTRVTVRAASAREGGRAPATPAPLRAANERDGGRAPATPATLRAAIEREVATLGEVERVLLRGAAVAGDPFDPELAAAAAGLASPPASALEPTASPTGGLAALDRLVAVDLVRPHEGARRFAFRHPLVRRTVYDASPPAWRLLAHERVAVALEARGAGAAIRAYHVARYARAGDDEAVAILRRAAEGVSRESPATAANWYATALGLVRERDRGELLGPLALALASAGRLEASLQRLHEALELAPHDLELVLTCARVEHLRGRFPHARRRLEAAYAAQPHPRLAFELAAAAMTALDGPALRAWSAITEDLAGERERAGVPASALDPSRHGGGKRNRPQRTEILTTPSAAEPAGGTRTAVLAPISPGEAVGAEPGAQFAGDLAIDGVLVAASWVLGALGRAWDGKPVPNGDLLAPLNAFDDEALSAHPTVLLHVSRALLRLERIDDAAALLHRAVAIARRTSSGEMLVWLLGVQAQALWLQLRLDEALVAAEAAEGTARAQAARYPLLLALSVRAALHHDRGEPAEAARAAEDCAALIASLEPSEATRMAASILASLHVTDDPERSLDALDHPVLDPSWSSRCALLRTRAALAAGHIEAADRHARAATARTAGARAVGVAGDRDAPARAARAAGAHEVRTGAFSLAAIRAELARAEVLLARGEVDAAAALADAAATAAEGRATAALVFNPRLTDAAAEAGPGPAQRSALDAVEARLLHGRALAAGGHADQAKAVLQRVAADAARGGAKRLMNAAARELRALGTRVSAQARRHEKAELSPREREIAELVAHGKSNKQVAAALYLSEKTVENALTRVYAKVGVRSRAQLARAWS